MVERRKHHHEQNNELTYPLTSHFWSWFSFSHVGYASALKGKWFLFLFPKSCGKASTKAVRCRACDLPGRKSFRLWLHQPETKGSNHRSGTPIWGRVGWLASWSVEAFTGRWKQIPVANGGISHYCCGFRISQVGWPVIHGLASPEKKLMNPWLPASRIIISSHRFLWKKHEPSVPHRKKHLSL